LYWDTLDPHHYIRTQRVSDGPESEILIVGGEDHKTGQDDDPIKHVRELEDWTRERFESLITQPSGYILLLLPLEMARLSLS
jgi:hypothetical protein